MHPQQHQRPVQAMPPKKSRGPLIAIVGVIVGLVALGGLFKLLDGGPEAHAERPPVATQPAVAGAPRLTAEQEKELLAGLREIDPALNHERSISRARDTCQSLLAGEERAAVVDKARQRFDGTAKVGKADATKIVELIESAGWCR